MFHLKYFICIFTEVDMWILKKYSDCQGRIWILGLLGYVVYCSIRGVFFFNKGDFYYILSDCFDRTTVNSSHKLNDFTYI